MKVSKIWRLRLRQRYPEIKVISKLHQITSRQTEQANSWKEKLQCEYFLINRIQSLSCVWLFATPMDCSMPGFPVYHQLPELVHHISDAIQPSHLLSSPSPPTFNLSHHQGLFKWASLLHQVPKCCSFSFHISASMNIQDWSPLG